MASGNGSIKTTVKNIIMLLLNPLGKCKWTSININSNTDQLFEVIFIL